MTKATTTTPELSDEDREYMAGQAANAKRMVLRTVHDKTADGARMVTEVYLLNPGECFHRFGGSRSGLVVRKTASLVLRQSSTWGTNDTEYDLADAKAWAAIRRCLASGRLEMPEPDVDPEADPAT